MSATLYIEHGVLTFPGTASVEWRGDLASALARARTWFDLTVVLVGRHALYETLHDAIHELEPDRVIFGGSRAPHTAFVNAVQLDFASYRTGQAWLLSTSLATPEGRQVEPSIERMRLRASVRVLPVRSDLVTPLVADDLESVFASFARSLES